MDPRYQFQFRSSTVAFNAAGIHAMRSGVIKYTFKWEQVRRLRVRHGMDYNNWLIMLILGAAMTLAGIMLLISALINIDRNFEGFIYFLEFNAHALTLMTLGTLILVLGLRRTMVMEVELTGGKQHFSLREIAKRDQMRGLELFVRKQLLAQATQEWIHPAP